ncbi:MAG TPA: right-handed parallel beta-helix repeat-containing protein [Candidatus Lokiarchaeia archaeon]|nr:right-handed parallel beta-helix repeat-containing protein [Candidatus Lokiarchaeia archaeon]
MERKKACLVISCVSLACLLSIASIQGNGGQKVKSLLVTTPRISTNHAPISINNNAQLAAFPGITGSGTAGDPYIIQDLVIDGGGSGSDILIQNTNVFLVIRNCSVINAGTGPPDAGILLDSCMNVKVSGNTATNNGLYGIAIGFSHDNMISGNTVTNNVQGGIYLTQISNNTISGNTALHNGMNGIIVDTCTNNTISGNIVDSNGNGNPSNTYSYGNGIFLTASDNNTISGNTGSNNKDNGLSMYYSDHDFVTNNVITHNNVDGISCFNLCQNNTISLNNASFNRHYGVWDDMGDANVMPNTYGNNVTSNYLVGNSFGPYFDVFGLDYFSNNTIEAKTSSTTPGFPVEFAVLGLVIGILAVVVIGMAVIILRKRRRAAKP